MADDKVCNFSCGVETACSDNCTPIESEIAEIQNILLTESGFLPTSFTKKLFICDIHRSEILSRNNLRKRSIQCGLPEVLTTHKKDNQKKSGWFRVKGDRVLNLQKVTEIQRATGVVVPIGTPICPKCRKALLIATCNSTNLPDDNTEPLTTNFHDLQDKPLQDFPSEDFQDIRSSRKPVRYCDDHDVLSSSSQETVTEGSTTCDSQASVSRYDRLEKLNEFLKACDLNPFQHLSESLENLSDRTKRRYLQKISECIEAILNTVCPEDVEFVKSDLFGGNEKAHSEETTPLLLSSVSDAYLKANTSALRRQLLSILTGQYSFSEVKATIPSLTMYKYYSARKHMENIGTGVPVSFQKTPRTRVADEMLDHFLDFITSNHIVKDLPFGEKTLVLTSGEIIQTPNVIRSLAPAAIVQQYTQLCHEENMKCLGTSTMYKILNDCSASVRQSVEGLDYYVAEGGQAFKELENIVQQLDFTLEEKQITLKSLVSAKHYLKTDFKLHVKASSSTPDHCCTFALSERSRCYSHSCINHTHTDGCSECSSMDETLQFISQKTEERHWDNPEATIFKVEKAVSDIYEWKGHILRAKNQGMARQDVLNSMDDGEVLVIADWAMKFLPRKFREGQTDWFAKRGINWHISFTAFKEEGTMKHLTHVHIFDNPIAQDAAATSAVLIDVIQNVCILLPNVKKVNIWSDNAGCYKSTVTLATLHQELGERIKSYNFCEPQDGKGPCDRKASHIKSAIKRYINQGNDVTDAKQMKMAISSQQQYMVKIVSPIINADVGRPKVKNITAISTLHNFLFTDNGLKVWRQYSIGPGKLIPWKDIVTENIPVMQFHINEDWLEAETCISTMDSEVTQDEDNEPNENDNEDIQGPSTKKRKLMQKIFPCPEEGCIRQFRYASSLEQHLLLGNCDLREEKLSLTDKSKVRYAQKLEDKDQRLFLLEKVEVGKRTGRKEDPVRVSEEMRSLMQDGKRRFSKDLFLNPQQIASFFSRLAKDRKDGDFEAAEADTKSE
ncbi:uncharacterized protein LOC134280620, partial [Saccostrea cucullata]|uniref:uncharacterized protein LOC134280620 n=1 Tax=Saccostrea cuccullata TaxID=36930 RepID=UPI002ED31C54